VDIVILCGKQGLALRGHRDDRVFSTEHEEREAEDQGNFIELVRFRAQIDDALRPNLQNAPRNALYTSKTVQNELIDIIGKHIHSGTLSKVQQARFFSIIADKVFDVANKEQLSLCLCCVGTDGVHEVFTDFAEVERITGVTLADRLGVTSFRAQRLVL